MLVCPNCNGNTFPAPEVDGVPTIRPDLLTIVQSSNGPRFTAMCPDCADQILADAPVSQV